MKIDSPEFNALSDKYQVLNGLKAAIRSVASPSTGFPGALAIRESGPELDIEFTFSLKPADGKCLLLQADNIGWGDGSFIHRISNGGNVFIGRRLEKALALDENGMQIQELIWPKNREEKRSLKDSGFTRLFSKFVLWSEMGHGSLSHPIWDKTKFLGWFSCTIWYSDTKDDSGDLTRFGIPLKCEISLDLYESPPPSKSEYSDRESSGFDNLYHECNFFEHLNINSKILTEGQIDRDHDLTTIGGMLYELAQQFYEDAFTKGIKKVLDGRQRGGSGRVGKIKVLGAEMCGYHRIMLEGKINGEPTWASLQVRPDSKNMLLIGCGGVLPNLRKLIRTTISEWPRYRAKFKPDGKVSVM